MNATIEQILNEKIIMIVRGVPTEKLADLAEAMYRGGIRLMECTYDATGRTPDEEIAASIGMLSKRMEGRMLVGAGTVLTEKQVLLTKQAGGKFIISPDTNEQVIRSTKASGLVSIPGALTPTEAMTAHRAGADFVKLFPVSTMGPAYVKAVRAPLSHVRFLAVGGVRLDNIADFLAAGALGVGIGIGEAEKKAIARGDFEYVENVCRALVERANRQ